MQKNHLRQRRHEVRRVRQARLIGADRAGEVAVPIERDTEAYDAFQSLKSSDALRVAFQRNGQSRVLEYKIIAKN